MGTKKLNVDAIANELQGASSFFPSSPPSVSPPVMDELEDSPISSEDQRQEIEAEKIEPVLEAEQSRITVDDERLVQSSMQASMLASNLASMLAKIHRVLRDVGREVSYTRLSEEEKKRIFKVIYAFKSTGIKTTENELMRIAVNVLLEDYDLHKEASILYKILHH